MQRPRSQAAPIVTAKATTPRRQSGEMKVYGLNACRALWLGRASDIIRVYVHENRLREFKPLLKWCAEKKMAYHVCPDIELEKVSASVHHEGIVILAKDPKRLDDKGLLDRLPTLPAVCPMLFLDGVGNPHNIGSMLRVATHFGAPIAMGPNSVLPRMTPSAARMAEGGMEHVALAGLTDVGATVKACRAVGFQMIAATSDGKEDLYGSALPARAIFMVGNEIDGLSPQALKSADRILRIPGTGAVDSLNVAMATALLLGEHWRQHHKPTKK